MLTALTVTRLHSRDMRAAQLIRHSDKAPDTPAADALLGAGTAPPECDHIFRARDSSDLTTADVKPRMCGWGGSRLLTPSCPCSLDLRQERQRGVAMGTVDRGLLWFDADRTPASGIPGLPDVDAMGGRTRGSYSAGGGGGW